MTDVIQQLLGLSEQVGGDAAQPQAPGPAIAMDTALNQDILQVSGGTLGSISKICEVKTGKAAVCLVLLSAASAGKQRLECGAAAG